MAGKDEVKVKPVRTYDGDDGFKHPGDAAYGVSRARAADLRANGLVEYVDKADEDAEIEETATAAADAVKVQRNARNKMAVAPANKSA